YQHKLLSKELVMTGISGFGFSPDAYSTGGAYTSSLETEANNTPVTGTGDGAQIVGESSTGILEMGNALLMGSDPPKKRTFGDEWGEEASRGMDELLEILGRGYRQYEQDQRDGYYGQDDLDAPGERHNPETPTEG